MRLLTSLILGMLVTGGALAQSKPVKIKISPLKKGKVQLSRGKIKNTLDLSKDISGCIVVYDRGDRKAGRIDTTSFKRVDEAVKGGKTYLVLSSEINSGCNISGECGAATDLTLIWLKLNSRLQIEEKKAVVVQSCFWGDINIVDDDDAADVKPGAGYFDLKDGKLSLKFETNRFKSGMEYSVSTLTYDHAQAEKGILVKTDTRPRPVD